MATKKNSVHGFTRGLFTDSTPLNQPKGSYRYALNSILESKDGSKGALISAEGNVSWSALDEGFYPVGHVVMQDKEVVIFSHNDSTSISQIGLMDKHGTYTSLLESTCLNFITSIDAVYRVLKGCERIVYFVDGINPDRVINVDELLNDPTLYNDEFGNVDCDALKQKLDYQIPIISNVNVLNGGGNLEHGTYTVVLQYEDGQGNTTSYFFDSHPIPIVEGRYGGTYTNILGGHPDVTPRTTKSIQLTLSNVDTSFKYVNIVVGFTKNEITSFYKVDSVAITNDEVSYTIRSLVVDDTTKVDLDAIVVDKNPYDVSKHIEIQDNRLIKANLKTETFNLAKFQQAANNIHVRYYIENIPDAVSADESGSTKSSTHYVKTKSLMRDEVYSLAIVWVLDNGREVTCHIPGRKKDLKADGTSFPPADTIFNNHNRPQPNTGYEGNTGWDSAWMIAKTGGITSLDCQHLSDADFETGVHPQFKYIERWKAWNTAFVEVPALSPDIGSFSMGQLAYFESESFYPMTKDCDGNYIYPIENDAPTPIRHHKMPDTTLEPHFGEDGEGGFVKRPLGLRLDNIVPPAEYADRVVGYYIAKEKRDLVNKTVLDKGIFYINAFVNISFDCKSPTKYQFQTNSFNRSTFRDRIDDDAGIGGWRLYNGLMPAYAFGFMGGDVYQAYGYRQAFDDNEYLDVRRYIGYDDRSQSFHAPKHKFFTDTYGGDHVKIESIFEGRIKNHLIITGEEEEDEAFDVRFTSAVYNDQYIPRSGLTNRALARQPVNIEPNTEAPNSVLSKHFWNTTQQETLAIELQWGLDNITDYDQYYWDDSPTDPLYYEGDGIEENDEHNGRTRAVYGSIKNTSRNIYGALDAIDYFKMSENIHDISDTQATVFGGDVFISKFSFFKSMLSMVLTEGDTPFGIGKKNAFFTDNSSACETDSENDEWYVSVLDKNLVTFFVESEINTELRHIDPNDTVNYNSFFPLTRTEEDFLRLGYTSNDGDNEPSCPDGAGAFAPYRCGRYPLNIYLYNTAYSQERMARIHPSLDVDFDYCSECQDEFPHRITYSEQSYLEDRIDRFLEFQANNYRDMPANSGEITNIFRNFDELYVHTEESLYKVFTKPYQINTDQATLYVGTGEFFSVPPRELGVVGYSGSTNKWATVSTEVGTFFVSDSGKVFLLSDRLNDISLNGMSNWFEENIPLIWKDQYENITGEEYTYSPHHPIHGTGFIATYDPRHRMYLLTKRDFNLYANVDPEVIVENPNFQDGDVFENKSWTIGYSVKDGGWASYYSYLPSFYIHDHDGFYSTNLNNIIWKHNQYNFQTYYGEKYPMVIEYVNNDSPLTTKTFNTINYIARCEQWDSLNQAWVDTKELTFGHMIAYTNRQSTGLQSITIKDNSPFASVLNSGTLASNVESHWHLNSVRDYVVNKIANPMTKQWSEIRNDYPIDKVPNPSVVDLNKSPFELEDIRDKFLNIRLFFNPNEDYRMIFEISDTLNNFSMR